MKRERHQDDIYLHTQHIFRGQEPLLNDAARNRAFSSALARHVKPGSSVLDIGAGTGIWSIAAALLGAGRVVAVEQDDLLIPIIRDLVRENGVGDKVEVIHGDSRRVRLDERFDLIVSETIGNQAFEEQIVSIRKFALVKKKAGHAGLPLIVMRITRGYFLSQPGSRVSEQHPRAPDVFILDGRLRFHGSFTDGQRPAAEQQPVELLVKRDLLSRIAHSCGGPRRDRPAVRGFHKRLRNAFDCRILEVTVQTRHRHQQRQAPTVRERVRVFGCEDVAPPYIQVTVPEIIDYPLPLVHAVDQQRSGRIIIRRAAIHLKRPHVAGNKSSQSLTRILEIECVVGIRDQQHSVNRA